MRSYELKVPRSVVMLVLLTTSSLVLTLPSIALNPDNEPLRFIYSTGHSGDETIKIDQETCLVPCDEIVNGGPGKDGIPSIDDPQFYSIEDAIEGEHLDDDDVLVAVEIDEQVYGFPHNILNWHEIVNFDIGEYVLSITYCPLTGTSIPFDFRGEVGVSGQLYENNLIMYDRETDSYWSQMYGLAINGERIGDQKTVGEAVETNWQAFQNLYPDAQVLTRDTGYNRDYDRYPYASFDYLNSEFILFGSTWNKDSRPYNLFHAKELTVVLEIDGSYALFPFVELAVNKFMSVQHNNEDVVVFFNKDARLAMPFINKLNGEPVSFEVTSSEGLDLEDHYNLTVYQDNLGNVWNIKGVAIAGPNQGEELVRINSYNAFWFAATSFFGDATIYTRNQPLMYDIDVPVGETYEEGEGDSLSYPWIAGIAFLLFIPVLMKLRRKV